MVTTHEPGLSGTPVDAVGMLRLPKVELHLHLSDLSRLWVSTSTCIKG